MQTLKALLDQPIDYAGLFPPAKLEMSQAIQEYLAELDKPTSWIVNRFVCPSKRLAELEEELEKIQFEGVFEVTVVGNAIENSKDAVMSLHRDMERVERVRQVVCSAYEVKLLGGHDLHTCLRALKKADPTGLSLQTFVELDWSPNLEDDLHETVSFDEELGFKARTGGVRAEAFPSVESLTAFLSVVTSLEAPFKFTAGIHEPLRYEDKQLGVWRYGFLNVLLASALALIQNLSRDEISQVLQITDPKQIEFGDTVRVGDHVLSMADVHEWWSYFGGFGSCSIQEPLEGLERLGYLRA